MYFFAAIDRTTITTANTFIMTPSVTPTSMTSNSTMEVKGPGRHVVHPGQNVTLLCTFNDLVLSSNTSEVRWKINHTLYGINAILHGVVPGYSANVDNANIIVENIMMNDGRNGTEYRCMLFNNMGTRLNESDPIILYVAGEYQYNMYTFNSNYCH